MGRVRYNAIYGVLEDQANNTHRFCVICTFFVYFCIYETKGLSLEEVDELYAK